MTEALRLFRDGDAPTTFQLYRDAVLKGAEPHYSDEQRRAWVPDNTMPESWPACFVGAETWIAQDSEGMAGFLTLNSDGYIRFIFVRPDRRRQGTSGRLYDAALRHARLERLALRTHASLLAKPFFERRGWTVVHSEEVTRKGVSLTRFLMELPSNDAC